MKKAYGSLIPFLAIHFLCCGTLLYVLTASGYLYLLSVEGNNKTFLLPSLILLGIQIWIFLSHKKMCNLKNHRTFWDHLLNYTLWLLLSLTAALIFYIYFF